jgi:hypothetical protein
MSAQHSRSYPDFVSAAAQPDQELFPTRLSPQRHAVQEFETTQQGALRVVSGDAPVVDGQRQPILSIRNL